MTRRTRPDLLATAPLHKPHRSRPGHHRPRRQRRHRVRGGRPMALCGRFRQQPDAHQFAADRRKRRDQGLQKRRCCLPDRRVQGRCQRQRNATLAYYFLPPNPGELFGIAVAERITTIPTRSTLAISGRRSETRRAPAKRGVDLHLDGAVIRRQVALAIGRKIKDVGAISAGLGIKEKAAAPRISRFRVRGRADNSRSRSAARCRAAARRAWISASHLTPPSYPAMSRPSSTTRSTNGRRRSIPCPGSLPARSSATSFRPNSPPVSASWYRTRR